MRKNKRITTPVSKKNTRVFPDLVKRSFTAGRPNQVQVADSTYLPVRGGTNLYLATVLDCYSGRLVGFSIADHMRVQLVEDALVAAKNLHGGCKGAIFHSDHGSVYTSESYKNLCSRLRVTQSMGAVGTSADNAFAESFNSTMKREVLQARQVFPVRSGSQI